VTWLDSVKRAVQKRRASLTCLVGTGSALSSKNCNAATFRPPSCRQPDRYVYCDCNDNGVFDSGESPISNVTVTLSGKEFLGGAVINQTTTTNSSGLYSFANLQPRLLYDHRNQPAGYGDGKDTQAHPVTGQPERRVRGHRP